MYNTGGNSFESLEVPVECVSGIGLTIKDMTSSVTRSEEEQKDRPNPDNISILMTTEMNTDDSHSVSDNNSLPKISNRSPLLEKNTSQQ